jgi:hypothetical protein
VKVEKRANKNIKIRLLFSETDTAKQNQKFPFHFLSAPPTPPAENLKLRKENFWFLLPRPKGADEARRIRAYASVSLHHARGACEVITSLCFGNRCEFGTIETQEQNLTAFSKPEGGTREARPTDFPPFFQTNSDSRLWRDGLFFRQEAGAKSEAILTHSICLIQKEFLLL